MLYLPLKLEEIKIFNFDTKIAADLLFQQSKFLFPAVPCSIEQQLALVAAFIKYS